MRAYEQTITVEGIPFTITPQDYLDWHYDVCYESAPFLDVEGLPAKIKLFVGQAGYTEDDLGWNSDAYVGNFWVYVDPLLHYTAADTVIRSLEKLRSPETAEKVRQFVAAQAERKQPV